MRKIALLCCFVSLAACDSSSKNLGSTPTGVSTITSQPVVVDGKMNQGTTAEEMKINADVRKSLVDDDSLSTDAKNATVLVNGTKVTLRGTAVSDQEKYSIEARTRKVPGVSAIDNQLSVKK